ncbi:hypothetical protein DLM78_09095 [Leptospira stimsonii]|uniref:Uncharacterized protein n=1 Tax=Leptospira stimsonii TaxID=2202203 RepID=A0A8B3CPY6_9LEPT|nr:hypothetical protein DLM78_09095 [Leptospira stimsonii]
MIAGFGSYIIAYSRETSYEKWISLARLFHLYYFGFYQLGSFRKYGSVRFFTRRNPVSFSYLFQQRNQYLNLLDSYLPYILKKPAMSLGWNAKTELAPYWILLLLMMPSSFLLRVLPLFKKYILAIPIRPRPNFDKFPHIGRSVFLKDSTLRIS